MKRYRLSLAAMYWTLLDCRIASTENLLILSAIEGPQLHTGTKTNGGTRGNFLTSTAGISENPLH